MAVTVAVQRQGSLGWVVTITETSGGAATEAELVDTVTGLRPPPAWLQRAINTRSAGAGATRQLRLATAAAATAGQIRYQSTATAVATTIDDGARTVFPIFCEGELYHRSQWDAGADNDGVTIYHFHQRGG